MTEYKRKHSSLVSPNCNQVSLGTLKRAGAMLAPRMNVILRWCWNWNNEIIINLKVRLVKDSYILIITHPIK